MKKLVVALVIVIFLCSCSSTPETAQVAATTLPVYEFTATICEGTPISVTQLVTETVSCLHDYSLNVRQVRAAESADVVVISGGGLEAFLDDLLDEKTVIDASSGIDLICPEEEPEDHHSHEGHHHEEDPHIWLSPVNAMAMAKNICAGLTAQYPQYEAEFSSNLDGLLKNLEELQVYGETELADLRCSELITFHDGFSYLADSFGLTILEAVEEESGSEASAKELIHLIETVQQHNLPAIFTEINGSVAAADIISRETGVSRFSLNMAMSGNSYFDAMYYNIKSIKEAME